MPEAVAVIGTREPDAVQGQAAFELAWILTRQYKIIVKTGAAFGIDHAAMVGADPALLEVVLPWDTYNTRIIPEGAKVTVASSARNPTWYDSVEALHPAPHRLTVNARHLHARNYGIIADPPVVLVVALPNARGEGGTAQGIRIAKSLDIPVIQFNCGRLRSTEELTNEVRNFLAAERAR